MADILAKEKAYLVANQVASERRFQARLYVGVGSVRKKWLSFE